VPPGEGTAPVLRTAVAIGFDLRSVAPDEASLEDAFVEAVSAADGRG
jgi:hypothetical protein